MLILSGEKSKPNDLNLAAFATFLGASVRVLDSPTAAMLLGAPESLAAPGAIAFSADTLATLYREEQSRETVRKALLNFRTLFLYGITAKAHDELLQWLSDGSLTAAETVPGAAHGEFPSVGKRFSHQLSGTNYPRVKTLTACDVLVAKGDDTTPIITVCAGPTFLCVQVGACDLFVSTVSEIPDCHQRVASEDEIELHYDWLLPTLLFVRAACGNFCWRGGWKAARLIIDDPVLRRTYGMLDFSRLFESMRQHRYATSLAYIPWNHSRTSRGGASFFAQESDRFSICVHGCDHTGNEYGGGDANYLEHQSLLAIQRMRRHQERTGLSFEPIMVFPQGRFTTACFRGLRSSGFLAAVNSTRFPLDRDAAPISLCELLMPTFDRAYCFPVFHRHYVKSAFPFLLDLFLGRPAFMVEHHGFFQNGFPSLEEVADRLNEAEPDLVWGSLAQSVERTCWKRALTQEKWEVRFFTDTFSLKNNSQQQLSYRLLKEEADNESLASLAVNGRLVPISRHDRCISIETTLLPGESARIQLQRTKTPPSTLVRNGIVYGGKVLLRRALCEFRDEIVVKYAPKRILRQLEGKA